MYFLYNRKTQNFIHYGKKSHTIIGNYGAAVSSPTPTPPPQNISIIFSFVFVVSEHELILITENMNSLIRLSNNVTAIITTMDK